MDAHRERIRRDEIDRAGAAAAKARSDAEARIAQQARLKTGLEKANSDSVKWFEVMPIQLLEAEQFMDQAENEFKESAFAPFWTSVEKAAAKLGLFDELIIELKRTAKMYKELSLTYEGTAPPFPIDLRSIGSMEAAKTATDRLKAIVRKAQRDFHFSMIYEQRKTNQLLISGFTTLAQALDGIGQRIAASISDLGEQILAMSADVRDSLAVLGEQIRDGNQQIVENLGEIHGSSAKISSDMEEIKSRHDKALAMLDNIQNHRRP